DDQPWPIGKDEERKPIAFWEWMLTDRGSDARKFLDSVLDSLGRSASCASLASSSTPETACYWNAVEEKVSSGSQRLVISRKMLDFGRNMYSIPRIQALTTSMLKYSETVGRPDDPRIMVFFQSELRKLIAEACTQTLPSQAQEGIRKRL